jgi:hypothetical protein
MQLRRQVAALGPHEANEQRSAKGQKEGVGMTITITVEE